MLCHAYLNLLYQTKHHSLKLKMSDKAEQEEEESIMKMIKTNVTAVLKARICSHLAPCVLN